LFLQSYKKKRKRKGKKEEESGRVDVKPTMAIQENRISIIYCL
jgi:hypothetical protein